MTDAAFLSSHILPAGTPAVGITMWELLLCSDTKHPVKSQPGLKRLLIWSKRFVLSSCALILHLKGDNSICAPNAALSASPRALLVGTAGWQWLHLHLNQAGHFVPPQRRLKISWVWLFPKEHPSGTPKYKLHHQGLGNNLLLFLQKLPFNVTSFHFIWAEIKED